MPENHSANGRLDSWKEIATYLNRDVRTVIRWEQEKRLPVHRIPGGKRQGVFAYKEEIDSWLVSQETQDRILQPPGLPAEAVVDQVNQNPHPADNSAPAPGSRTWTARTIRTKPRAALIAFACLLVAVGIVGAMLAHSHPVPAVRPFSLKKLTNDGRSKSSLHTDGKTLYYNQAEGLRSILVAVPVNGGPVRRIDTPFSNVLLQDISRDGTTLLVISFAGIINVGPLWTIPAQGGTPHRLGDAECGVARWSPDNRRIACAYRTTITVMNADGSNPHAIGPLSAPAGLVAWSPDGTRLRYILQDTATHINSQWETVIGQDGEASQAQELLLGPICCRSWTWAGTTFVYVNDVAGRQHLMTQTSRSSNATELPINLGIPSALDLDQAGDNLYFVMSNVPRGELLKFDQTRGTLQAFLNGVSGAYLAFSPDGQWITYADTRDYTLWRSRVDGSQALQLTKPSMEVQVSSWSPDGRQIAFMGMYPGQPFRIYLVDRDGGPLEEASDGNDNQGGPSWSPHGATLVYGNTFCEHTQNCQVRRLDLKTHSTEIVPGSHGLRTARWSPNGKFIAALKFETHELMLWDVQKQEWRKLAGSVGGDNINWSADSQYVYVDSPRDMHPVIERVRVRDGMRSTVVNLADFNQGPGIFGTWIGLAPDNSPILSRVFDGTEIYKLEWTGR